MERDSLWHVRVYSTTSTCVNGPCCEPQADMHCTSSAWNDADARFVDMIGPAAGISIFWNGRDPLRSQGEQVLLESKSVHSLCKRYHTSACHK